MKLLQVMSIATCLSAGAVSGAPAFALDLPAAGPIQFTPVVYGYGPKPYGLYGTRHRYRARRSYGTGYHGRGTRTGGPVGGIPSRN